MKLIKALVVCSALVWGSVQAQNISIATGGTGGVYYPMGGGLASVLSKKVPGLGLFWRAPMLIRHPSGNKHHPYHRSQLKCFVLVHCPKQVQSKQREL